MHVVDALSERYEVVRRLGEGGFGIVYEARDAGRGDVVAIKLLRRDHAGAVYRFKREFRSLAEIVHPNLVRLYELVATDDVHYFTMELVDGVDLMAHLCGEPRSTAVTVDLAAGAATPRSGRVASDAHAVRRVFSQLANGLHALHAARKLHCDIKPSNVLVDRTGRVVLVDFGLVAELDHHELRGPIGTPGYTAPEIYAGRPLTPAADWYSVGAVLHEVLVGRCPEPGERCSGVAADLADLAELCTALLAVDPTTRPDGAEVVRRLGGASGDATFTVVPLIGREHELERLRDAWRDTCGADRPVVVRVIAASGLGKTALVEAFLASIEATVLRGRCYEQESVPYKGIDALIDALAAHLRRNALRPLDDARGGLLARMFPVLRDIWQPQLAPSGESQQQRQRAFESLRDLLRELTIDRPIVCFLDDVQWGDVDGARLLRELLRPPGGPRMLVICTYRPDAPHEFIEAFDEDAPAIDDRRIELAGLSPAATRRLAMLLSGDDAAAASISAEADGSPLFVQQLATSHVPNGRLDLSGVILSRVDELDVHARRLVETVALAGQPISEAVALHAATLDADASRPAAMSIRHKRLVVASKQGGVTMLAPAHDRIREAVTAAIAPNEARMRHGRIADALLARGNAEPDVLVWHFQRADDAQRTRHYALAAAERADQALAFDRAAGFYQLVLEQTPTTSPDRCRYLERRARALADAGRAGDAAEVYELAGAVCGSAEDALTYRLRAAELTLRSGRLPLGIERTDGVLRAVGVRPPRSRASASALAAARRTLALVRGFDVRRSTSPSSSARLDALFSASTGLAMANHVLADALHLQHMNEALKAGDPSHIIRALGHEATFQAVIGGEWFRRRYGRLLAKIDDLAQDDPYLRAWVGMARGICAWFEGQWAQSWQELDAATARYRDCRGVAWELAMCNAYRLPALAYLGDIAQLSDIVPRAYAVARDLGDLFAANTLRLGQQSLVRLAEDRPDAAIDEADAAIQPFPRETYLGPHYHHLFAVVQADLYRGRPHAAWTAIDRAWRDIKGARFLMAQCLRVEIRQLRARVAIALAAEDRKQARRLHAVARKDAETIAKDRIPPAAPLASALRAAVAAAEGHAEVAREAWDAAIRGFDAAGMAMHASAARARLGAAIGGTAGAQMRHGAESWFRSQRVVRPDRLIAMVAP